MSNGSAHMIIVQTIVEEAPYLGVLALFGVVWCFISYHFVSLRNQAPRDWWRAALDQTCTFISAPPNDPTNMDRNLPRLPDLGSLHGYVQQVTENTYRVLLETSAGYHTYEFPKYLATSELRENTYVDFYAVDAGVPQPRLEESKIEQPTELMSFDAFVQHVRARIEKDPDRPQH